MPACALSPPHELERLARLRALDALDSGREAAFDALAKAAAAACGVPFALISLIDEKRQWFKATVGIPGIVETPRSASFCAHALLVDGLMEVPDATLDARFADSPLVTGPLAIRFYASMPIVLSDGLTLGSLCVADRAVRRLDDGQHATLRHLATAAGQLFEMRDRTIAARQQADRQAAERIASLYRAAPAMLHSIDADGVLHDVSDTWLAELGFTREQVIGRPIHDFFTPESRQRALETQIPQLFATGRCSDAEVRMLRADGSEIDLLMSSVVERRDDGSPPRSTSVSQNITLRRQAETALREERERMARIVEGTDAGTWELDIRTGETLHNARWAEIAGYTLAELGKTTGATWRGLMHKDDLEKAIAACIDHYEGKLAYYEMECRIRHKSGAWLWILDRGRVSARDASGQPLLMHGTRTDITARKRIEEALRASQDFLNRVGQVAGVGGWELDFRSGRLTWSEETRRLHEVAADYAPTIELALAFFDLDGRPVLERAVHESAGAGSSFDLELPFHSARGRAMWARAAGTVEFVDGKPGRLVGAFQDITRRKQMERDLAENRELLQVTLESIGDAVVTTDNDRVVRWLNPVAERMTGWTKAEAVGRALTDVFVIVDEQTRRPRADPVAVCLRQAETVGVSGPVTLIARDGGEYGIEDSASPIRRADGELQGAVLVFRDVSEQRRLNRELNHRATHDPLTGLLNRCEFEARLTRLFESRCDDVVDHTLLYIDLDQFKLVNDACGHGAGDTLLRQVSAIFGRSIRGHDSLARLGGDEFGVILERCDVADAQRVAQKMCDEMDAYRFVQDGRRFRVGTSIGLVPIDRRWTTVKALLQAADASCYAAKDGGRNRVHAWFDSDRMLKDRQGDMQWVSRIENALDEDRFELFGQRIEAIGGASHGLHFEVLLRLREAGSELFMPGAFLPAAERFHLATRIDRWVVRRTFEWLAIASHGAAVEMLSINLSGQSLGDSAFHRDVVAMMRSAAFDLRKLCFEITETAAITHLAEARTFIEDVRALGAKVALDDFGAGASSFGYLKSLPVDFLKIDGHFITNLLDDALNNAAVRCFCDVAKVVGVRTIAEFVEREDIRDALRAIGVDYAQGYLIHRPEPLDRLLACLAA